MSAGGLVPCRIIVCLLSFLGFVIVYMLRVNLSVALVSMVNNNYTIDVSNSTDHEQVCPVQHAVNQSTTDSAAEFNWDEETQGIILGSFFWGYIITQIPGGIAAEVYGAKWVFGVGVLWTSVLTLLTPITARWGPTALICLRVLEGIGEGVSFPAVYAMLGRWAPAGERTFMTVFTLSGTYFGTVLGLPLSGWLCASQIMGGWPSAFYLFGATGCLWFILWSILVYSTPQQHPRISDRERQYIEDSLRDRLLLKTEYNVPLKAILTSVPVWSLVVMHVSFNWSFFMMLTYLPTFLSRVLAMPIVEDSILSALPYLSLAVAANVTAVGIDYARSRRWLSTTTLRKAACLVGSVFSACGLIILGHIGCDIHLATICLATFVGLSGIAVAGYGANHLDLSPQYSGTLLGITNSLATIPGMIAPVVVGAFTNHASTRANWLKVFYLSAGINMLGAICYLCFGSGNLQPWGVVNADSERDPIVNRENDSDILHVQHHSVSEIDDNNLK